MRNTKYTKKQITEAIAYWKKQLKTGNYKKLDESEEYTARLIDNDNDDELDSVECSSEELVGLIEQLMYSYNWKGNIKSDAVAAAKAIRGGSYFSSKDGKFTIEP